MSAILSLGLTYDSCFYFLLGFYIVETYWIVETYVPRMWIASYEEHSRNVVWHMLKLWYDGASVGHDIGMYLL